jgi:predicted NBD/HSP70 family sugar kinase
MWQAHRVTDLRTGPRRLPPARPANDGRAGQQATRGAGPQLMRAMNERLMLEVIREEGPVSRAHLARTSGLSKPTVGVAVSALKRDGLVRLAGMRTGMRGPAASLYEIRPEAGFVLGLDVGREYLRGAIADITGVVRARGSHRVRAAKAERRIAELDALAEELAQEAGVRRSRITQVVVGSPGVVDANRGPLIAAENIPGWGRPDVVHALREALGRSMLLENDVSLAALAERDLGHGRGVGTFCFVSIGTGIGMGLVIDGSLHRGFHGAAGEISYLPIGPSGTGPSASSVRRHGELESAAAAAAVVRAARRAGVPRAASSRHVFEAAAAGDTRARDVVAAEAELVAKAVASVVAVVDPELVVLGGGIGRAPGFATAVAQALDPKVPFAPDVVVSALGDDAVADGCLALGAEIAWRRLLERE